MAAEQEQVKLYAAPGSPFSVRAQIALNIKAVKYEYVRENIAKKSDDLLRYNPVHKKIPVLLHNGNPVVESLVIVEYVDEVWRDGPGILPRGPYERAMARFWARFVDDKFMPALWKALWGKGEEQEKAFEEARSLLKTLENELEGKKFFGGETIGLVDISALFIAYWLDVFQEIAGIEVYTKEKFPRLSEWIDEFLSCSVVKEALPTREYMLSVFRPRFSRASA